VPPTVGSDTARRTFRALEPIHGMVYFSPYGPTSYAAIGITHPRMGYFASRSAALGAVPAEVVVAMFFNFSPALIHRALPAAWDLASPADVLAARDGVHCRRELDEWRHRYQAWARFVPAVIQLDVRDREPPAVAAEAIRAVSARIRPVPTAWIGCDTGEDSPV